MNREMMQNKILSRILKVCAVGDKYAAVLAVRQFGPLVACLNGEEPKDIGLAGVLHLVEQIRRRMTPPTVVDFARMWAFSGEIASRQAAVRNAQAKRAQEVESWLASTEDNHSLPSGCLTGGPNV